MKVPLFRQNYSYGAADELLLKWNFTTVERFTLNITSLGR